MNKVRPKDKSVRLMLLELGVGRNLTTMVIPMVWFLVGTTDPDNAATIEIIRAVQRGLRRLGFKVEVSGIMDHETAAALQKVSGVGWESKTWIQLIGDVIHAINNPWVIKSDPSAPGAAGSLGAYFEYSGKPPGPLPGYKVGLPPGPLGATAEDSGIELNYGRGKQNEKNMVPVDSTTMGVFQNLQRQINRLLSTKGGRIDEDGIIGPQTLSAAESQKERLPLLLRFNLATTQTLAHRSVSIADAFQKEATKQGISPSANRPPARPTTVPADQASKPLSPGQATAGNWVGVATGILPWALLAGGVAYGVAYYRKRGK